MIRCRLSRGITLSCLSRFFVGGCLLYAILFEAVSLHAQELVRTATSKPQIESFKNPETSFQVGPLQEALTGSLGVEYTDNVNLTDTDKLSDLSVREGFGLNTTWVISQLNMLQLNFAGTLIEDFYGNGKSDLNLAISPDSLIQFQFVVSDFRFRVYDSFAYVQNPTSNATATNTANLNSLTNTIGATMDSDLNLAVLSLSADYTYSDQSGSTAEGQNNPTTTGARNTFRAGSSLTFHYSPTIVYGLNATVTRSTSEDEANVNSLSVGPLLKGTLGPHFDFDLAAGLNAVDTKPSVPLGYYFSIALRYQIDRHWQLLFSASHDLGFSIGNGLTEDTYLRAGAQLSLTRYITVAATSFADFGDIEVAGPGTTTFTAETGSYKQFGGELSLAWKLRKHLTGALTYDFTRREAQAEFSYLQNSISLSITYAF